MSFFIWLKLFKDLILNSPNSLFNLYNKLPNAKNKVIIIVNSDAEFPKILVNIKYIANKKKRIIRISISFIFMVVEIPLLLG